MYLYLPTRTTHPSACTLLTLNPKVSHCLSVCLYYTSISLHPPDLDVASSSLGHSLAGTETGIASHMMARQGFKTVPKP